MAEPEKMDALTVEVTCVRTLLDEQNYVYGRTYRLPQAFIDAHKEHFQLVGTAPAEAADKKEVDSAAEQNRIGQERYESTRARLDKQAAEAEVSLAQQELERAQDLQKQKDEAVQAARATNAATPTPPPLAEPPKPVEEPQEEPARQESGPVPRAERLRK